MITVSLVFTTDLYFLIKWLDTDDTLYDTIPFRDITAPEGLDVLSLLPGETCQASFANQLYDAEVVAVGMYTVDISHMYGIRHDLCNLCHHGMPSEVLHLCKLLLHEVRKLIFCSNLRSV